MKVGFAKQQDFLLRLGLLRTLVALLPNQRLSVAVPTLHRKLDQTLFRSVRGASAKLIADAAGAVGATLPLDADRAPTIADALLFTSGASSWGQPEVANKKPKILEWAQTFGFVRGSAQGYQITERGIFWKSLIQAKAVAQFVGGDALAWNPFRITPVERAFLFFHLGERDELLWH